jgi:hypothetical protein
LREQWVLGDCAGQKSHAVRVIRACFPMRWHRKILNRDLMVV